MKSGDLPLTTIYWCAMPTGDPTKTDTTGEADAIAREVAAGCGWWREEAAFWSFGFGMALTWVLVVTAVVAWTKRYWSDQWPWLLIALPLVLAWWLVLPFVLIGLAGTGFYFGVRSIRAYLDGAPARKERRLAAERVRAAQLEPIIQQLDRELNA